MKKVFISSVVIVLFLAIGFGYIYWHKSQVNKNNFQENSIYTIVTPTPGSTEIKFNNLSQGQTIISPLIVTGEVKGNWFFEASFPVALVDDAGNTLAETTAAPLNGADWMTQNFVPFKVKLVFKKPQSKTGTIIFRNDNPSVLPQNDKEFSIKIKF